MKKVIVASAVILSALLAGCADSNYAIHTIDGRTIVSDGKPKTDNETGMISYKDAWGNKQQINQNTVKQMQEIKN
ncbi:YgdI/YgdR family lipoprotein [Chimaeribacter arupi]|uniref:YgdI/YgdR family lipoprotein n=2 Tax=Yersiniaceae TaxID=1903411 RepID=A0A2N5ELS1_9GAMM|nr:MULTISPECIES: YgdI/YgdR family lipoprotein [Yersiniaceae]MBS0967419.1 YgdI/YgdR family lipoprotein [Nissabacter archeti]MDV5141510.1 YgdI/YgdR family lipoprotein [Chimaeribacter arupi]PLR34569.1 YgdI/YgdR family lipoprotein [Chimaeribacter arupi]PLR46537.1 YgdI/YgdR family lipoprotein [Chimaeribacter arupi]PLR47295.1 YgdI/YgdR family lipoprotein [Chimaeribacter arupi]